MNKDVYEVLRPTEEKAFRAYIVAKHNAILLTYNDEIFNKALSKLAGIEYLYLNKCTITLDEAMKMISGL